MNGMEASMCSCDSWDGDAEPSAWWCETWPKARKPHHCGECGDTIPIGAQHQAIRGCDSEGPWTHRTCMTCARIRRDYCAPLGCLRDELWEALGIDLVTGRTMEDRDETVDHATHG